MRALVLSIFALLACPACSPEVVQHVEVRDPHRVTVYDRESNPLLPTSGAPGEAVIRYRSFLDTVDVLVRREPSGAVVLGTGARMIDEAGRFDVRIPANADVPLGPPTLQNDALYFTYPVVLGTRRRREATRVLFATPVSNVIVAREERIPTPTGAALVFGILFTAIGTAIVVDGLVRSGVPAGQRVAEITLGTAFAAPGIAGIAVDLYGFLAPKTTRVIVEAPR